MPHDLDVMFILKSVDVDADADAIYHTHTVDRELAALCHDNAVRKFKVSAVQSVLCTSAHTYIY
jgi:hypothetical protein